MGFTCYSPLIARGPTISQLKKLTWRGINKPPWEGLRGEIMRYRYYSEIIPDQV